MIAEAFDEGGSHWILVFDISKAHRRIPVLPEEWGRQACQVRGSAAVTAQATRAREAAGRPPSRPRALRRQDFTPKELSEDVYVNKVGTFGVSSAGYWWGRAVGAVVRLTHYALGHTHALWALIYSDDGKITAGGDYQARKLLLHMLVLMVLRVPISWKKVRGGPEVEWIGYFFDLGRLEIGVTFARAVWASNWLSDKVAEGRVRLGELREGLGMLQFIAGPVEHIRPFLGPLYAWSAAGPRFAKPALSDRRVVRVSL